MKSIVMMSLVIFFHFDPQRRVSLTTHPQYAFGPTAWLTLATAPCMEFCLSLLPTMAVLHARWKLRPRWRLRSARSRVPAFVLFV